VLLVDDGSQTPVREALQSADVRLALESGRLRLVRYEKNRGKGAALQSAFEWAVKNNFTHVISMDTDGQHLASEIQKLVKESLQNPWALVIGSRRFAGNVPGISKFGRQFSNFWVDFETGTKIEDSQSGFRVYPLFFVQNLSFFTKRYDFEIEVLIRLMWMKVEVREVAIDVHYPPAEERVSHFDKFWDNARISLLNCVLVAVSLLRGHLSAGKSAVALGLGVAVGCTPFFGLHTLMVTPLALLFRLNFLLLFLGTQISLPFIAPFLAMISIYTGGAVMGISSEIVLHSFQDLLNLSGEILLAWTVGSIVVGAILGTIIGGAYYVLKRQKTSSARSLAWTGKTRGGKFGNAFLKAVLKFVGLRAGYFCLFFIVPYFYLFAPRAKTSLNQYWRNLESEKSWLWRQLQILRHFFVFGQVLMDRIYQSYYQELKFGIANEGPIYIGEVAASKRGWVFIGAHTGGWDISTLFFRKDQRSARLGMVHFLGEGLTFDKVLARASEDSRVDSIASGGSEGTLLTVRQYLEDQRHVGFLADRAIGTQVELIPFLGKLAPFESRPFRVAAACKAPLICAYTFKLSTTEYKFITSNHRELTYNSVEDRRAQIYNWTESFVKDLELQVRRFPHQWFNFYPFWSSLPVQQLAGHGPTAASTSNCLAEELHRPTAPVFVPEFANSPNA